MNVVLQCGILVVKFQQCVWVNVNYMVNDEFQLCQIYVFIWQVGKVKCFVWVVDIYYDFQWQFWYGVYVGVFYVEIQYVGINIIGIIFCVGDGYFFVFFYVFGGVVVVDYCWNV